MGIHIVSESPSKAYSNYAVFVSVFGFLVTINKNTVIQLPTVSDNLKNNETDEID